MNAHIGKLAAVAAMALGLALSATPAMATPVTVPTIGEHDGGGSEDDACAAMIRLKGDSVVEPVAGWMVGRFFVGFQLPE